MKYKKIKLNLTDENRAELKRVVRRADTDGRVSSRARVVLLRDEGYTLREVADILGFSIPTVRLWLSRYTQRGISGLSDEGRSGRPSTLTPETSGHILTLTVEMVPCEATHWSERTMAKHTGISRHHVRRVWKSADLKPHRIKNFKISNDPKFAEKVVDVVGLYLNPPDNALVLSVDEKTQIQALDRTQPMLPLRPRQIERRTHDYKRHGVQSLYAALNIKTGNVIGRVTVRHRAAEFIEFLEQIDKQTPKDLDLHLIADNSSTHKTKEVNQWLADHPRFHMHFTPTSASWMNAVESWFSQLERRALYRGVHRSVKELRKALYDHIEAYNASHASPFRWTKTAHVILEKVDKIRKSIEEKIA